MENQKFNIPKKNSLDSMEGINSIKNIKEKLIDIEQLDLGYSLTTIERLKDIMNEGLVGLSPDRDGIDRSSFGNKNSKEEYLADLKKNKKENIPEVFFNIVGRTSYVDEPIAPHEHSSLKAGLSNMYSVNDQIVVIFDTSSFNEVDYREEQTQEGWKERSCTNLKHKQFMIHKDRENRVNSRGKVVAYPDMGFKLSPRVPPRFIKGLVFKNFITLNASELPIKLDYSKSFWHNGKYYKFKLSDSEGLPWKTTGWETQDFNPDNLEKRALEIAQIMLDSRGQIVPIYDEKGNMWWPQKMSHEEIVKMKAEEKAQDAQD